jgi:hypothetical protein
MDDISNMIMHCSTISRQYEQIINLYGVNRYSIILLSLMFATVLVVIYSSCKHFFVVLHEAFNALGKGLFKA